MKKFGLVLKGEKIIVYSKPRPPMPPSWNNELSSLPLAEKFKVCYKKKFATQM